MDLKLGFLNDIPRFHDINFPNIPGILHTEVYIHGNTSMMSFRCTRSKYFPD